MKNGNFTFLFVWVAFSVLVIEITSFSVRCWLVDEKRSCLKRSSTLSWPRTTEHFLTSRETVAWYKTKKLSLTDHFAFRLFVVEPFVSSLLVIQLWIRIWFSYAERNIRKKGFFVNQMIFLNVFILGIDTNADLTEDETVGLQADGL